MFSFLISARGLRISVHNAPSIIKPVASCPANSVYDPRIGMSGIFVHNTWMSIPTDQWADQLHAVFLAMVGYFNRPEPDAMMIVAAGIKLDRALFPLLSRIGLAGKISVVELGHITGKDHSTV